MSLIDEAAPVRAGEALDDARLGEYLASHIAGPRIAADRAAVSVRVLESQHTC